MTKKLKSIFSNFLSSMTKTLLVTKLCPPDLIVEIAEIQKISGLAAPKMATDTTFILKGGHIWFCTESMEITLNAKPAITPLGFLKMLYVLRKSIG